MKAKIFMLAAAAFTLSLASCQKDETTKGGLPSDLERAYAKVNVSLGASTRALTDQYDAGTKAESEVNTLFLLIVDGQGNTVGTGSYNQFDYTTGKDESVENTYDEENGEIKGKIIQVTMNPGNAVPEKLYAFVNTDVTFDNEALALDATSTIDQLQANGFVMTNSAYRDGSWVVGVDFTADNLFSTADAAEKSTPVEIYVERLAAKISADEAEDAVSESEQKFYDIDGKEYKLTFNSHKWAATGVAKKMYTFKRGGYSQDTYSWAEQATKRTFWAEGFYYDIPYANYADEETRTPAEYLDYIKTQALIANDGDGLDMGDFTYVTEHTNGPAAADGDGKYEGKFIGTNAIVVGYYSVEAVDDGSRTFEPVGDEGQSVEAYQDFYLALNGSANVPAEGDGVDKQVKTYTIYTKEDLMNRLFTNSKIAATKESGGDADTFENLKDAFDLGTSEGKYVLTVKGPIFKAGTDEQLTSEDFVKFTSNAAHYLNGWAYFMAPIEHNGGADTAEGAYGVVRNHSYKLTINSYKGLGAPLDESKIGNDPTNPGEEDPDVPIVPDPSEEKDMWINATLNVLGWHTVTQDVEF